MSTAHPSRSGVLLIMVAGLIVMLAGLAMTFLGQMRSDAEDAESVIELAQARLMLHAGMSYIQEASRLGYGDPAATAPALRNNEAWGWIDVRHPDLIRALGADPVAGRSLLADPGVDYVVGPRGNDGRPLFSAGSWPAPGTVLRASMLMFRRPPFAVIPHMYRNPIPDDPSDPTSFGIPSLHAVDPLPALGPGIAFDPAAPDPVARAAWVGGDLAVDEYSRDNGWFRIYRETGGEADRPAAAGPPGATFVITVGSGASHGFRDWSEVVAAGAQEAFATDPGLFEDLRRVETIQWFRVEWSAAVGRGTTTHYHYSGEGPVAAMAMMQNLPSPEVQRSVNPQGPIDNLHATTDPRNYVGTIRYVQRLDRPPLRW